MYRARLFPRNIIHSEIPGQMNEGKIHFVHSTTVQFHVPFVRVNLLEPQQVA